MSLPAERILNAILVLRGEKVLLDADLAAMYEVETRSLIQAIKRNPKRFPSDFMFQLSAEEWSILRSQSGISSSHGGRRTAPYAFTEQGVAMLSSVLHSERAIAVNIEIMRAFVHLKRMMATHADLTRKLDALEGKYDRPFKIVFDAIRALMEPRAKAKKPIGFGGKS